MIPQDGIEKFFSTIDPWIHGYSNIGFSYFSVLKNNEKHLLQARVFLNTSPSLIPPMAVETQNIAAGHLNFSELGIDLRDFVNAIVGQGSIETPLGKFIFPTEEQRDLSVYFEPFHQEGVSTGNRLTVLTITGARKYSFIKFPDFDWELKSAIQPFDSVDELLNLLALGGNRGDIISVEIVAPNVAAVNLNSNVSVAEARPSVFLAKSLDPKQCKIGYRVFLHGKVEARGTIHGGELTWTEKDGALQGDGYVAIPKGSALHCIASYAGQAQHQGWIADPKKSQNSRRVILEEVHDGLKVLESFLFDEQRRGKDARDLEFGVAWLMWMLGFSPSQVGGRENTSDAVDILAATPNGNILVVECTTGLLKSDKVAKLVDRTEAVRKRLASSGNQHLKVMPVIVTSKLKDEIKADLEDVQKKGVAVITREDLESALTQTIILPNAEPFFDRLWLAAQPEQKHPFDFAKK